MEDPKLLELMDSELIHQKIIDIMKDLDPIEKTKDGYNNRFKYRGIDDAFNACQPLFVKHGVYMRSELVENGVRWHFATTDGSSIFSDVLMTGIGKVPQDAGIQMSYTYKTAIWHTFCIPTEDAHKMNPESKPTKIETKTVPDNYKENFKTKICKLIPVADNAGAEWVYLQVASEANSAKLSIREYAKENINEDTIDVLYKEYLNWKDSNETNK